MYSITLCLDGKYYCMGRMQGDTQRWTETDLATAIKSMKEFAKTCNSGAIIKKKDIDFLREIVVQQTQCVHWNPNAKIPNEAKDQRSSAVQDGRTYSRRRHR